MSYYDKDSQHSAYDTVSQNVGKTQQVVMLYDGLVSLIRRAKEAAEEGRILDVHNQTERAVKIVMGLEASLDFEKGGEVAELLGSFYISLQLRLLEAQREKKVDAYDAIIDDVKQMSDAWKDVDEAYRAGELSEELEKVDAAEQAQQPAAAEEDTPPPANGDDTPHSGVSVSI